MSPHLSDLAIRQLKLLAEVPIINIIRQISKQERSIERHSLDQAHQQEDHIEQPDCSSISEKENQIVLSTSNKTKFQYQYLLIAVVILAIVSVIALYQSGIMPKFSAIQAPAAVDLSWPPRPDFSHLNQQVTIPVTGSAEGLAEYHSGGWGGPVVGQNDMDIYHPSSIQYDSPGR
jgi:hypothetical protein